MDPIYNQGACGVILYWLEPNRKSIVCLSSLFTRVNKWLNYSLKETYIPFINFRKDYYLFRQIFEKDIINYFFPLYLYIKLFC